MNQSLIETENPAHINQILEEYGVCILKNVLNSEECRRLTQGMIEALEYVTSDLPKPFRLEDKATWKTLESLYPAKRMMYQHWSLGHSQFIWDVRCNPKVINAFATIWGTDDLLVSFDGMAFHLPPEENHKPWQKGHWYHTDQSFIKDSRECIQGQINGFDTNEGDATLVVLVGSHKHHQEYGQINNLTSPRDWYLIEDIRFFTEEKGCIEHRITCPKGSLVLWDSRTIHYGSEPLRSRKIPNYRALVYLCYTPREKLPNEEMRRKKIEYFENLRVTNHWPHLSPISQGLMVNTYRKIKSRRFHHQSFHRTAIASSDMKMERKSNHILF